MALGTKGVALPRPTHDGMLMLLNALHSRSVESDVGCWQHTADAALQIVDRQRVMPSMGRRSGGECIKKPWLHGPLVIALRKDVLSV